METPVKNRQKYPKTVKNKKKQKKKYQKIPIKNRQKYRKNDKKPSKIS